MQGFIKSAPLTHALRSRDVQAYFICEMLTGSLICFMGVFSPWAFGTTEPWSIWTMNVSGYCLGLLFAAKWLIRTCTGYSPDPQRDHLLKSERPANVYCQNTFVLPLGLCTCGIMVYCLLAAANSKATYSPEFGTFQYHEFCRWLPSSLNGQSTRNAFLMCLALLCSFWAIWDWLNTSPRRSASAGTLLPGRLQFLLWLLALSGAALGIEAILQRMFHSSKLLLLVLPRVHQEASEQFGPYAYRANAAQYFNLLWPVCLGFWWVLAHWAGQPRWRPRLMLLCAGIMASCPIVSSARGGALACAAMLLAALLIFFCALPRRQLPKNKDNALLTSQALLFVAGALALGLGLGWNQLGPRLESLREGFIEREALFDRARRIGLEYPLFGTGPGTFEQVFQLYRTSPQEYWPAQLHNDWLEIRITWGLIGSGLIGAAAVLIVLRPILCKSTAGAAARPLVLFICLSLAGCLVQARWDFPLQIYSILFLCVVWCAVLFAEAPN